MARSRLSKRSSSSSSSYTSTITVVAFIALCVIGVWMLTSNSVIPPQTTTRIGKATATATDSGVVSSSSSNVEVHNTEPAVTKDSTVYEDNPGDLPDDAIKSDDPKTNSENDKDQTRDNKQEKSGDDKNVQDKGTEQETVAEEKTKGSTEEQENQVERESQATEDGTSSQNQQADQGIQGNEDSTSTQDQDSQGREDSTSTQNQQPDQENQGSTESERNQQTSNSGDGANEQSSVAESVDNPQESQPQKSNGDQQQNKEHQQQEDSSSQDSQNQAAKEDQQQPLLSTENNKQEPQNEKQYEVQQIEQRLEDAGIQNTTQEPQHVISDEDSKQRIQEQRMQQQQQQQQQQKQNPSQDTQQSDTKTTQDADTQTDKQETKQETATGDSSFPGDANSGIPKESKESKKAWSTQVTESENQKGRRKDETDGKENSYGYTWQLCNVTAGTDYIPCLDNEKAIKQLHSTRHFEHRERHCPTEGPTCLVPLPQGYKRSIKWPQSRDKIWYHNVPHTKLAEVKGHQNWVKVTGEFLTFPGGGTQFIHGALHYIDFVEQAEPKIAWGKHTRVILDVGCGVASFGGFLFEKDVLAMSFAPKDEHEAQVQFALERGIPAISSVMGSQRLQFPSRVFDLIHCARCRVPWHVEGGKLLLELNRVLRPGGYFVWSATPVYQKLQEDVEIWKEMSALTVSMCWDLVTIKKDKINSIAAAVYRKPTTNDCYDKRKQNTPPMCQNDDDPNAAWYVPLQACMHRVPIDKTERGAEWPKEWPLRLQTPPYWLNSSQMGIYGKPAPEDFAKDYEHWKHLVNKSYMKGLGISWSNVRNVMDMRAVYGGFAAALKDLKVWVMNVVNVDSPDTLPIIYERGLFGMYHDWCESFSTYPRTYDLLHADHLFSKLKKRCRLEPVMAEVDRILRPGGKLIVRDKSTAIGEVENLLKSLRWEVHLTFSKDQEGMLSAQKGDWRPETYAVPS